MAHLLLHPGEPHQPGLSSRLNWLRAAVLGANDGIVSTAGLVVGVAGATTARGAIATAGLVGLVAGASAMALGEYVSVSSQRDSELALLARERQELRANPEQELEELATIYRRKGLSPATAQQVAVELTAHDAFAAHLEAELHLDSAEVVNPWHAAGASALSFATGALLPLAAMLLPPASWRIPVTIVVVLLALALTGAASARLGGGDGRRAAVRMVVGGALGLAITFVLGHLVGGATG